MPAQGGGLPTSPAVQCRQARGTSAAGRIQVRGTGNGTGKCSAGASLGTCPLLPSINRPKKPLEQNVSRVGASAGWSGEWEQTEYLDELGVWGVFRGGSALRESWGFYVLNTKFPLEAEGCERVAQPTAAY